MKFKAALIDCDGTIVDSEKYHWQAWLVILNPMGINIEFEEFAKSWVGKPEKLLAVSLLEQHKIELTADDLIKQKTAAFRKICDESPEPLVPGIEQTLIVLKEQGVKMAVVSGGQRVNVLHAIQANNLEHYFETVVTANDVVNNKPAPDSYLKACKELGVEPSDAFAIEDSASGIQAAKSAELTCYGIHHDFIDRDTLNQADWVADNHPDILDAILKS